MNTKSIGGYKHPCNVYNPDEEIKKEKNKYKVLMEKFTFYFDRFQQSMKSLDFAQKKKKTKIEEYWKFANKYKSKV